jgi:hypothetical protein
MKPANSHYRDLEMVRRMARFGTGHGTTPRQVLATIESWAASKIDKMRFYPQSSVDESCFGGEEVLIEVARVGLIVCPRCEGQRYDRDACGLCRNLGVLDANAGALTNSQITGLWDALLAAIGRAALRDGSA